MRVQHLGLVVAFAPLLLGSCSRRSETSADDLSAVAQKTGVTYEQAFDILSADVDLLQGNPRPLKYRNGIIVDGKYFFPVRVPMYGTTPERGYYVDPVNRRSSFIDRPDKRIRVR